MDSTVTSPSEITGTSQEDNLPKSSEKHCQKLNGGALLGERTNSPKKNVNDSCKSQTLEVSTDQTEIVHKPSMQVPGELDGDVNFVAVTVSEKPASSPASEGDLKPQHCTSKSAEPTPDSASPVTANVKPANQTPVKVPCPNQHPSLPVTPKGGTSKSTSSSPSSCHSVASCFQTAKPIPSGCKQATTGSTFTGKQLDKNSKRNREDKIRKKDDKSIEHVFKALSNFETTEEKLGAMCQKYADIFNEHRILQNAAKLCEKKNSILQKEKEQLQADHSKAVLTRSRLENLCRELQRQNKAVKDDCMSKIREEEEKKRDVATKFQSTLTELGNLLAQNNDKNAKLRDDNLDMTTRLKNVCEQYEQKEKHVEKLAKQMHLEIQLSDAKFAKAKMEMAMEKETLLREKQQLLIELSQCQGQLEEMRTSEIALRNQIQLYNDKYDEFHKALLQSNEAIGSFKQEMERMSKQIRKLEKETVSWKSRYEAAHRTLLQMTEEKLKSDQNVSASNRKLVALQGLCRSLQAQCASLRNELKGAASSSTSVSKDQEEELMNQVEKELNDTAPEAGLPNDNSPCPRQLSMESAEKINGEVSTCEEESDKKNDPSDSSPPVATAVEPLIMEKVDLPEKDGPSELTAEEGTSSPVEQKPSQNGNLSSELCDTKNVNCQPTQQVKKNRTKKKNKK